jgi:hypothetical protein
MKRSAPASRSMLPLLMALGLTACATDRPMNFACTKMSAFEEPISVTPIGGFKAASLTVAPDVLTQSLARAFNTTEKSLTSSSTDVLVLSGGGKWGAYGAGLYEAWGAHGRPTFRVVTGVSTGALQATLAFLGRDTELVNAYSINRQSELVKSHGDLFFLTHGSTADLSPLRARVRDIAGPLMDEVAAEGHKGRLLYVGAINAQNGQMYAVNLTRMAQTLKGEERLECYSAAVLSSAAIPAVFRQITVDGVPYYDAGVRNSVFVAGMQAAISKAFMQRKKVEPAAKANVYILMNGVPGVKVETKPIKAALLPTLKRLQQITFDQIEQSSIYAAYVTAAKSADTTTYLASAAGHNCKDPDHTNEDIFNPAFMKCLIGEGRRAWANGSPWTQLPKVP